MWAPLCTLAPLGTLARGARGVRWGPRPFPWRLRPAQARPGPWRRAEGAGGGGEQAVDPGKKRIWLLRPRAAAPRGALGASDHDGELQPRAAAAARGCEALARPASSGTRPAGCGRRGGGGRPGGPRRPPGAAGPGDRDGAHPAGGCAGSSGRSLGFPIPSALVVFPAGVEPR